MDELPNDILLEIFDCLDRNTLYSAMKVCARWKHLVTSSSNLMKKIEIFIRPTNIDQILAEEIDIPHKNLMIHTQPMKELEELNEYEQKLQDLVENYRESAEFCEMVYSDSRYFFTFIQPLSNLTHLNLIGSPNSSSATFDDLNIQLSMPRLKTLGLKTATNLLKHLCDHKVEVLKIIDVSCEPTNENINNFLRTCHHLKEVKFMGFIPQFDNVNSYDFQLEALSILLKGQAETTSSSALDLVKSQRKSLKELKLVGFTTNKFVEYAISSMTLQKFEVDLTRIRSELNEMKINKTINKMMLQTIALSIPQMQKVISVCRNIEDLKIVSNSNLMFSNWLLKASQSMENLKHLYIDSLLGILLPQDLNFKRLETLTITKLGGDAQILGWVQLVSRCPTVKKIIVIAWGQQFIPSFNCTEDQPVEQTYLRKNNLQFILVSLPELEEIELRGNFPLTDEVVDVLVSSNSKLRKFTFASENNEDVKKKLRRFDDTKIQCTVVKPVHGKKALKRKIPQHYDPNVR